MDIATLAAATTSQQTASNINMAVLKIVMDTQRQSVAMLIDALEASPSLPPHLSNNVNTTA